MSGGDSFLRSSLRYSFSFEPKSFENSYIPENPRTPKPLTFSKNRLRGAKNRSNISPVAKIFFRKNDFFFPKTLCWGRNAQSLRDGRGPQSNAESAQGCCRLRSLYNTYLKRFVKKILKKKRKKKKSCTYAQKIKKSCTYAKVKKKYRFFGNFFQRIVMIKNILEGSEVGFLKGITGKVNIPIRYLSLDLGSFENSYIPENPRTPKPLNFSKNRLRGAKKRSNTSPVANFFSEKTIFFFKNFGYVHIFLSLYNTYLKGFVKTNLKKNAKKKKVAHMEKKKFVALVFSEKKVFATELVFERFLAFRSRFFKKVNLGTCEYEMINCKAEYENLIIIRERIVRELERDTKDRDQKVKRRGNNGGVCQSGMPNKYCTTICEASQWSKSFENSYIPENPRTPSPLTFSKNRLRGAKNRSNISPVAKKNFRKNDFFFSKNFAYVQTFFFVHMCTVFCFVSKPLKNTKLFKERIVIIKNVLEGSKVESRSFENSYIPENPRTLKPLTFSKNRLRGAKNRSNISPVAKKNFRKNDFFFSENFAYVQKKILCICAQSLYNTYLKRFVKKNLKKNAKKKKLHICTKNKKKLHICKRFRSRFFERNNGLGDIGNWGSSRVLGNI
ncbi:hypothetical protein LXL04_012134 [Taraxacum kok-saghyz]